LSFGFTSFADVRRRYAVEVTKGVRSATNQLVDQFASGKLEPFESIYYVYIYRYIVLIYLPLYIEYFAIFSVISIIFLHHWSRKNAQKARTYENAQNPGCLGYIGDSTSQSYGDYNKKHCQDPLVTKSCFHFLMLYKPVGGYG